MADLGAMIGQMAQQPDSGQQIASTLQGLGQQAQQSSMQEREMAMQEQRQELLNEQRRAQIEKLSQEMDMNDLEMARQEKEVLANEATGLLQHFDQQGNVKNVVAYERAYQNAKERAREMGSDVSDFPSEAPMDPTVLQQFRDAALGAEQVAKQAHEMKAIKARHEAAMDLAEERGEQERMTYQQRAAAEARSQAGGGDVTTSKGIDRTDMRNRLISFAQDNNISLPESSEEINAVATRMADEAETLMNTFNFSNTVAKDLSQTFYEERATREVDPTSIMGLVEVGGGESISGAEAAGGSVVRAIREISSEDSEIASNPESLKKVLAATANNPQRSVREVIDRMKERGRI